MSVAKLKNMLKGFFHVPKAVNEPVKSYAPNSPEKQLYLKHTERCGIQKLMSRYTLAAMKLKLVIPEI